MAAVGPVPHRKLKTSNQSNLPLKKTYLNWYGRDYKQYQEFDNRSITAMKLSDPIYICLFIPSLSLLCIFHSTPRNHDYDTATATTTSKPLSSSVKMRWIAPTRCMSSILGIWNFDCFTFPCIDLCFCWLEHFSKQSVLLLYFLSLVSIFLLLRN